MSGTRLAMADSARAVRCVGVSTSELGRDEFGVIQSRDDVAVAGQVIRQESVASPAAAATRMREKDDRANFKRFRRTPDVAWEAAVSGGVERLHAPLSNGESARNKWVIHELANDTTSLLWTKCPSSWKTGKVPAPKSTSAISALTRTQTSRSRKSLNGLRLYTHPRKFNWRLRTRRSVPAERRRNRWAGARHPTAESSKRFGHDDTWSGWPDVA
jgi:hypothetical protein